MRSAIFTAALLLFTAAPTLAHPQPITDIQHIERDASPPTSLNAPFADITELWKRKGGGGKGGKGSGSSSSSSSSGSSGSSSSGSGRGAQPSYGGRGGGRYYGGGSTTPYRAGSSSPRGIAPVFLGVGALAIFPGIWLYGAYSYPYHHPYSFRNRTANNTNTTNNRRDALDQLVNLVLRQEVNGVNQTKPVDCLCAQYADCGCDDNDDTTFLDSIIGDGTYDTLNKSLINVVDVNGTSTIVLNGTLENGTTVAGSDEAGAAMRNAQSTGYLALIAMVGCAVFLI